MTSSVTITDTKRGTLEEGSLESKYDPTEEYTQIEKPLEKVPSK